MRPTSHPQSALRHPLNHVLGTEAGVRVLRVLTLTETPVGVTELARLASLQATGVARLCTRLEDLGVIEAVGRGSRNRQYRISPRFPFRSTLGALFAEERSRAERVLQELRAAIGGRVAIHSAWVEGPVARGADRPGDTLVVGVLVDPGDVEVARADLWQHLLRVQQNDDLSIELRVVTLADLKTATKARLAELEDVVPLNGPPPLALVRPDASKAGSRPPALGRRHERLDERARVIAQAVAERIRRDPSLVEDARRYVETRLRSASSGERLELQEWLGILATMSVPRLRRFLVQDDARAVRLRQSLPFLNVLSDEERRTLFAAAEAIG